MNAPTKIDAPLLAIRKSYRASPQAVFDAFTKEEALSSWFNPHGGSCETEINLRVGGDYSIKMGLPDGEIALLEQWVRKGAADPRELNLTDNDALNWWSLKPLTAPASTMTIEMTDARMGRRTKRVAIIARRPPGEAAYLQYPRC